jgi:hypothetical protein
MIILFIPFIFMAVCWLASLSFAGWVVLAGALEIFGWATTSKHVRRRPQPPLGTIATMPAEPDAEPSVTFSGLLVILVLSILAGIALASFSL